LEPEREKKRNVKCETGDIGRDQVFKIENMRLGPKEVTNLKSINTFTKYRCLTWAVTPHFCEPSAFEAQYDRLSGEGSVIGVRLELAVGDSRVKCKEVKSVAWVSNDGTGGVLTFTMPCKWFSVLLPRL
jgi:hypothetical protein